MEAEISLNEIQERLEDFVEAVEQGNSFVITRDGKFVAELVPVEGARVLTPEQQAARERTLERMRQGFDLGGGKFNRDELHDRSRRNAS